MSPTSSILHHLLLHKYVLLNFNLCSLLITLNAVSLLTVAQTQITRDHNNPLVTSEQNVIAPARISSSISSSLRPQLPPTNAIPTITTTTGDSLYLNTRPAGYVQPSATQHPPPPQQKFLKFTLIAGKYWKFNIKTNSLQTSHSERELRLHRNVSSNNFIIDDDGWFQYNHQQQQLFAWPSYSTKPTTYYFVLLPSGLDYEADGENVINSDDIVVNIVVELIRPYISSKLDLEQLLDHKFSLEHLHRHSGYPLLLSQIVSIFDIFARNSSVGSSSNSQGSNYLPTTTIPTTTTTATSVLSSIVQSKQQARFTNRLAEFLLIDSHSTSDGEYFSITWTTHPSLVNNTILPINECRLSTINDTVSRLSSRSILYPDVDDKFSISFSLEGPLVNSQAIIPTERGNYALKLILNASCRRRKIIEELGIASAPGIYIGLSADIDDRENSVLEQQEASSNSSKSYDSISTLARVTTSTTDPSLSTTVTPNELEQKFKLRPGLATTHQNIGGSNNQEEIETAYSKKVSTQNSHLSTTTKRLEESQTSTVNTPPTSTRATTLLAGTSSHGQQPAIEPTLNGPSSQSISNTRRALETPTTQSPANPQLQQSKLQPQAKSFINFLDSTDTKINSIMAANETSSTMPPYNIPTDVTTNPSSTILNLTTVTSTIISGKNGQESSLNDDLIGILNEIMEFLVSIAVPLSVILGFILVVSILMAICNLCMKRRKSKQFVVGDRFKFRYGSERKGFLKNSSKPVILEADQKSLSMGGTPLHKPLPGPYENETDRMLSNKAHSKSKQTKKGRKSSVPSGHNSAGGSNFFAMSVLSSDTAGFSGGAGPDHGGDCGGDFSAGDCGGGGD